MKTFTIEIRETLSRRVQVVADDSREAALRVQELYDDEDIVLGADDYESTEMQIIDYGKDECTNTERNWLV